jgi:very-short-patch-repair endonuclease
MNAAVIGRKESQRARPYPSSLWGGVAPKAPGWGMAMPHSTITKRTRGQARVLCRSPTDAERKLWFLLRSLKSLGMHFRRQAPIGVYIADFVWHAGKVVVELDGSQHVEERAAYDAKRTAWLESQGYRVLRFWNNDVLKSPRRVGEAILAASKNPTPNPSPPQVGLARLAQYSAKPGQARVSWGGEPAAVSGEGRVR